MNAAKKLLAMALAMTFLVGTAGGVCASNGGETNGTLCVTIDGDTISFEIVLEMGAQNGTVLSFVPKPMIFYLDNSTGIMTTGPMDTFFVQTGQGEVTKVIARTNESLGDALKMRIQGSLNVSYLPAGTPIMVGPYLFLRPDQEDPYGGGGGVINLRPDQEDPY